jgi:hypothetical protein
VLLMVTISCGSWNLSHPMSRTRGRRSNSKTVHLTPLRGLGSL